LKRSPSDCDDAGEADMPQIIPDETAANTAILQYLFDRATVMTTRLSPMRRPWYLTSSDHRSQGRVITAQWRRTQGACHNPETSE
jgi:hypothetical protein